MTRQKGLSSIQTTIDEWRFYVTACEPKKYCDTDRIEDDAFACSFFETKSNPHH